VTGYCGSVGPRRSGRDISIAAPRGVAAKDDGGGCSLVTVVGERLKELGEKKKTLATGVGYSSSLKEGAV
jgi:hypothetical protein